MEISPLRLCPGSDVNPGSGPRLRAARRSDLIFGAGISTDNTRFVHVEHNVYVPGVPGHPVRFGSDDDVSTCSCSTAAATARAHLRLGEGQAVLQERSVAAREPSS
jgi:hypothetical protein